MSSWASAPDPIVATGVKRPVAAPAHDSYSCSFGNRCSFYQTKGLRGYLKGAGGYGRWAAGEERPTAA
eukprot:5495403-Alexandrium_andersonii.AAC.1